MDKEQCMLEARILQAQGYTQLQIAEELGVTDRTVRMSQSVIIFRFGGADKILDINHDQEVVRVFTGRSDQGTRAVAQVR